MRPVTLWNGSDLIMPWPMRNVSLVCIHGWKPLKKISSVYIVAVATCVIYDHSRLFRPLWIFWFADLQYFVFLTAVTTLDLEVRPPALHICKRFLTVFFPRPAGAHMGKCSTLSSLKAVS